MSTALAKPILWCYPVTLVAQNQLHTHDYYEFFFCTGGEGVQHLEGKDYPCRDGDLFFFPDGLIHAASPRTEEALSGIVLQLNAAWLTHTSDGDREALAIFDYLCQLTNDGTIQLSLTPESTQRIRSALERMAETHTDLIPGYRLRTKICLLELLDTLLQDPDHSEGITASFQPESLETRLANTLRFIEEHSHMALMVEEMARMACLSRSHFHALFKEETGSTFMNYLNGLRVRQAAHLLTTTQTPITAIAIQCGFPSLSHFYHTFRRLMKKTPRQIRLEGPHWRERLR
ncbi:MAG: helix-turn-helix domain-containing protein [Planctomycetota bacterium]|jgi:AraC-like DNA-binding protein